MPDTTAESTLSVMNGKALTGWEEIRQALIILDRIPEEERNGARVEICEYGQRSGVKVSFFFSEDAG